METESWLRCWCSTCGMANWYCQGDLSDCTQFDYDGIRCFECDTVSYFITMEELYDLYEQDFDDERTLEEVANIIKGLELPS